MAKEQVQTSVGKKIIITIIIIFGLAIVASLVTAIIFIFQGTDGGFGANVAIIPIEGEILASGSSLSGVVSSDTIIQDIDKAEQDSSIKAVIFRINSPGGSAVASDEIASAIKHMSKPSVAVIREVGASGAYWSASATRHVIANRMSITGSIGVIGSYLSFGRFLDHWNVTYNQLISGERKDTGDPMRELSREERAFLQEKIDAIHEMFIAAIAQNRNMSVERVRPLADGRFFLGTEAKDAGLVDELGGDREALAWINRTIGEEPVTVEYKHDATLLQILTGAANAKQQTPEAMLQQALHADSSVPMAK